MRNKRIRSLIALVLAVISMGALLAACDKDGGSAPKVKLQNVYSTSSVPLPEGVQRTDYFMLGGDKVYFATSSYIEEKGGYTTQVYSMDLDGSNGKIVYEYTEGEGKEPQEEGIWISRYITGIYVDNQGRLWVGQNEHYEDSRDADPNKHVYENRSTLSQYDENGNEVVTIDLMKLAEDGSEIYANQVLFDQDGSMVLASGDQVHYVDLESLKITLSIGGDDDRYFDRLTFTSDGGLLAVMWDDQNGGQVAVPVDKAAKKWGEPIPLPKNTYIRDIMPGSGAYYFYFRDELGIQGYNKETGETQTVLNWINSNINPGFINNLAVLPDGRFLCAEYSYEDGQSSMSILTEVPESEIKETVVITLAARYMDYDVRSKIIAFNKSQDEHRIVMKTYDQFDTEENNWQGSIEQINYDIMSGNIPDIISLNGLNANTYISKGLLTDLYELIDADETVSREDYLQNILDACSKDGKLYQFLPTFSIFTLAAKTSLVGSNPGWTMEDMTALLQKYPESNAFSEMTRQDILDVSARLAMDAFIDMETGECDFNSPAFIQLLEFANSFPEKIDWEALEEQYKDNWDEYYQMYENQYKDNKTLLMQMYVYDIRSIRNAIERFGEDVTLIGFPTSNKNGASINSYQSYAISSKSKTKQVCWDFIKQFAPSELKIDRPYYNGQLSINRKALEQLVKFEMTPMLERPNAQEYFGGYATPTSTAAAATKDIAIMPMPEDGRDDQMKNYPLTQAEVDQMMSLITSVNQLSYQDTAVLNIITEEVGPFFEGKKSATATAEIIQSRVQLYVAENQ